jgi:hypothetical protein
MQTGRGRDDFQNVLELNTKDAGDELVPSLVHTAHLTEVTRKAALVNESRQRGLERQRGVPVGDVLGGL